MKTIIKLFITAGILLGASISIKAQISLNDSIIKANIHRQGIYLALSDTQEQALFILEKDQIAAYDINTNVRLSIEERKKWLAAKAVQWQQQLKEILSDDQYRKYLVLIEATRQDFLKYAKEKKINVEGPDIN